MFGPDWSADGTRIVFSSTHDSPSRHDDVFVMNDDGTGQANLTNSDLFDDRAPAWATDGRIAFQSNRSGNWDLFVMNADGTGVTQLTFDSATDLGPSWSPDGGRIVFASSRDGNLELYVLDLVSHAVTRLTDNPARTARLPGRLTERRSRS